MRKILIISALDIWSMGKDKGAPSLWYTLKGYADNDWKVFFITGNKKESSIYNVHKNIEIIRFDCKWIKKLFGIKKIGFLVKAIWWFYFQIKSFLVSYKIAKTERIDIFYAYEILGVPAAKILSKIFKKPIVSRFQGTKLVLWVNKNFWKIRFWQHVLALKLPVNLLIMTNDGTQGNLVLKSLKVNTSKIAFWMNGVNKNIYNSNFNKKIIKRELGILEKEKILLTVSRLENWKKVDRIIKAIPCVIKEYQNFKLLVIGKGTERKKLENLVTKLQVTKYIKFLGALQYQKLKKYYNLADVFISLYDISNVGNPLLEAMSCGKCIITLDVGGTNKFIFNNQNGILLKTNDLNKLPKIIIMLLKDNNLRKSLGKAAKNFADKNFWTWKERIDTELSEVNKLIKND
jgi:glycosyltransferase involved in cell wall biosynthesis